VFLHATTRDDKHWPEARWRDLLALMAAMEVKGLVHITGGGLLDNIPRVLPEGAQAVVDVASWKRPAVFDWLQEKGNVDEHEMHRVLNCGVGMVICVAQEHVEAALSNLAASGEQPWVIGQIGTAAEGAAQVVLNNLKAH